MLTFNFSMLFFNYPAVSAAKAWNRQDAESRLLPHLFFSTISTNFVDGIQ